MTRKKRDARGFWGPVVVPKPGESPLAGTAPLTPEEVKQIYAEVHKKREEEERVGPPTVPSGVCAVCSGKVEGEFKRMLPPGEQPIYGPGGRNQYNWVFQGYACVDCGIMYKFLPNKKPYLVTWVSLNYVSC